MHAIWHLHEEAPCFRHGLHCTELCRRLFISLQHHQVSEAQGWRKRNMTHQCSHEGAPASAHASANSSVHESAHESWVSLCCSLYKGSHSSAHVSAHAGAHASVHEVVWSYVTWSVFTCSESSTPPTQDRYLYAWPQWQILSLPCPFSH